MIDLTALFVTFFTVAGVAIVLAVTGLAQVATDLLAARTQRVAPIAAPHHTAAVVTRQAA